MLPDGRVRWIHERALLLADADSGERLVHGVLVDVTEERTSLEVAERVGRLFRTLIEHSREAVTIVDESGVVLYQNPSMGRVVGRPPEWFEGKTPLDLMPPEDAARGPRGAGRSCATGPALSCPASSVCATGTAPGGWSKGSPPTSSTIPRCAGIILNYRDVTDEREQARQLRDIEQRRQTLLEDIINAEAEQRSRIAEELHDDTIQVMTASLMELDRIDRHLRRSDVDAARDAITSARAALTKATERTRRLTFELRPQLLEAAGLAAAVRDLADALAPRHRRRREGANAAQPPLSGRHRDPRLPHDPRGADQRPQARPSRERRRSASSSGAAACTQPISDDGRGFRSSRRASPDPPTSASTRRASGSGR